MRSFITAYSERPWFSKHAIHEFKLFVWLSADTRSSKRSFYCRLTATADGWMICATSEVDISADYWMDRLTDAFGISPNTTKDSN